MNTAFAAPDRFGAADFAMAIWRYPIRKSPFR